MKKQSAIRWIQEALEHTILTHEQVMQTIGLFEQAVDMEKEQIMDAYGQGVVDEVGEVVDASKDAEQYYEDKYELHNEEDVPNETEEKGRTINIRANIYKKILDRK